MTWLYKILIAAGMLVGTNGATWLFAYGKGQMAERTATQVAALRQIERAQEQTTTWREAYDAAADRQNADDDKQRPVLARIERGLERMRSEQPRATDLPRNTPQAVGEVYEEAERDIVGCADDIGRFSAEAADAARSHQRLDGAWPDRAGGRKEREASRAGARSRD